MLKIKTSLKSWYLCDSEGNLGHSVKETGSHQRTAPKKNHPTLAVDSGVWPQVQWWLDQQTSTEAPQSCAWIMRDMMCRDLPKDRMMKRHNTLTMHFKIESMFVWATFWGEKNWIDWGIIFGNTQDELEFFLLNCASITPLPEGWEESNSSVNNWMKIQHTSYGTMTHMTHYKRPFQPVILRKYLPFQGFHVPTFDPWRFLRSKNRSRWTLNLWAFWAFQFCYVLPCLAKKRRVFDLKGAFFFPTLLARF